MLVVLSLLRNDAARARNVMVRFFTPGTQTELGKILIPSTLAGVHLADDTTNVITSTNTVGCHVANDTTNIVTSAAPTTDAATYTLLNEIKADYNAHRVSTAFHAVADTVNAVTIADATTDATASALANDLKSKFNAHRTQVNVHVIATWAADDATNVVTTADSTEIVSASALATELKADYNAHRTQTVANQGSVNTLLNELKTDYEAHRVSTTFHSAADTVNAVTSANATDLATSKTLAAELRVDFTAHRTQAGVHPYHDYMNVTDASSTTTLANVITLANELKADYNLHRTSKIIYGVVEGISPGTYDVGFKTEDSTSVLLASKVFAAGSTLTADGGIIYIGELTGNDEIDNSDALIALATFGAIGGAQGYAGDWLAPSQTDIGTWAVIDTARRRSY